jgi:hypothetical protein
MQHCPADLFEWLHFRQAVAMCMRVPAMPVSEANSAGRLRMLAVAAVVSSCGGVVRGEASGVGGSEGSNATVSSATASGTHASSTTSSSGVAGVCPSPEPPSGPCAPGSACAGQHSACLAVTGSQSGNVFGMRVDHLAFELPAALAGTAFGRMLATAAERDAPACNLDGTGSFNWLLQFDTQSGTITTGGAKPPALPSNGYSFVKGAVFPGGTSFVIGPTPLSAPLVDCDITSSAWDVFLPVYLDQAGTELMVLPLHQLQFFNGTFSSDHACIGSYNAQGLAASPACSTDAGIASYVDGAMVRAYFLLGESDHEVLPGLDESLCVFLSGDPTTYGDGASPARCKTSNGLPTGEIIYQGDWCAATNQPGSSSCHDAVQFRARFAASGVSMN